MVALARARGGNRNRPVVLAIGEAKGGASRRGVAELARLERLRELLSARAVTDSTRLLLFSRGGFTKELATAARRRGDVELVDLARLYGGD